MRYPVGGGGAAYKIVITPADLYAAARTFTRGADQIAAARQHLASGLDRLGGMAGNDPAGKRWGASFDKAVAALMRTLGAAEVSVAGMGQGLAQTANNVLAADHHSAIGHTGGQDSYPLPPAAHPGPPPRVAPAEGAGSPPWPAPFDKIPNGHQDQLHAAAAALRQAAGSLEKVAGMLENAVTSVTDANSSASLDAMTAYFALIWGPGSGSQPSVLYTAWQGCTKLAQACDQFAAEISQAHQKMEHAIESSLTGWRGWLAGGITIVGILGTVFTGGGSDEAAAVGDAADLASILGPLIADLASAISDLSNVLDDLIALLDAATGAAPEMDVVEAETTEEVDLMEEGAEESEGLADANPPNVDSSLAKLFENGPPKAGDLEKYAQEQGWTKSQTPDGPIKYTDENGVVRMTIKRGSPRAPGSDFPHVELRNADGQRVDPYGVPVTRKSLDNHTPIIWDLG